MGLEAAILWPMLVGGATSIYQSERAASTQRRAQRQAQGNADRAAAQADQDRNRANQRQPNADSILATARRGGQTGLRSTMLTGSAGVDPDSLRLGRSSLLGA